MTLPKKCCGDRTIRWVTAAAIAALILGAILSRVIEPGVRVEKTLLTTNTPALRIFPATPGPHPSALLAHGNGGSKEMLFRFGEALAGRSDKPTTFEQFHHPVDLNPTGSCLASSQASLAQGLPAARLFSCAESETRPTHYGTSMGAESMA